MRSLIINPGGTSTKIAVFDGDKPVLKENVLHDPVEFEGCQTLFDQEPLRKAAVLRVLEEKGIDVASIDCVVGRGGLLNPLPGGTYAVNDKMMEDMEAEVQGAHPSNLGAVLARRLGDAWDVPSYVVDPVAVDEFIPEARITGLSDIPKASWLHALNQKAVCRHVAKELGGTYADFHFIVAHLGSGNSIAAHRKGRMVDGSGGRSDGPFSPERTGGLPAYPLVELCFSGRYTHKELVKKISSEAGFYDYLGTKDLRLVEERIENGDAAAKEIMDAFVYQVAKEICMYAATLDGQVDAIILTGGIAHSESIMKAIRSKVEFLAPVHIVAGELEMEALAAGALRVWNQEEEVAEYTGGTYVS